MHKMIPFCCVGGHYAPTRASERVLLQCCAMSRQLGRLRAWLPAKSLIWQPAKMPMGGDIVGTRKRHLGWALKDLRRSSRAAIAEPSRWRPGRFLPHHTHQDRLHV